MEKGEGESRQIAIILKKLESWNLIHTNRHASQVLTRRMRLRPSQVLASTLWQLFGFHLDTPRALVRDGESKQKIGREALISNAATWRMRMSSDS